MSSGTNKERIEQNNSLIQNNNTKITNVTTVVNTLSGLTKDEYNACLELASSIETDVDYSDATATSEDILAGKIAYAKGERLVGTLELKNTSIVNSISAGKSIASNVYMSTLHKKIKKIDGTLIVDASCVGLFAGCEELEEAPNLDFSNITSAPSFDNMFQGCLKLKSVPAYAPPKQISSSKFMFENCSSLVTAPAFDFTNVNNIYHMFYGCSNLVNLPTFNIKNGGVQNLQEAFTGCDNLSDDSLNKILNLIIRIESGFSSLPHARSLNIIGLTAEQVDRCKTLSNWSAFENLNNWSTGY